MRFQIKSLLIGACNFALIILCGCRYDREYALPPEWNESVAIINNAATRRDYCRAVRAFFKLVSANSGYVKGDAVRNALGEPSMAIGNVWYYEFAIDRVRTISFLIEVNDGLVVSVGSDLVPIDEDDLRFDSTGNWEGDNYRRLCHSMWHDAFTLTNETAESLVSVVSAHFAVGFDREGARRIQFQSKNFKSDRIYSAAITGGALESQIDELSEKLNVLCTERWTNTGGNITKVYTFDFSQPYDGPGGYQ